MFWHFRLFPDERPKPVVLECKHITRLALVCFAEAEEKLLAAPVSSQEREEVGRQLKEKSEVLASRLLSSLEASPAAESNFSRTETVVWALKEAVLARGSACAWLLGGEQRARLCGALDREQQPFPFFSLPGGFFRCLPFANGDVGSVFAF